MTTMPTKQMELLEVDEPDISIICKPWIDECNEKAEWMLFSWCCDVEVPCCPRHKAMIQREYISYLHSHVYCKACGVHYTMELDCWRWEKL